MPQSVDEDDVDWLDKCDDQIPSPEIRLLTCSQQLPYIVLTAS